MQYLTIIVLKIKKSKGEGKPSFLLNQNKN